MIKNGTFAPQNRLAERESALAAYVLCSAYQIAETSRLSGAPERLVKWLENEVTTRFLVVIEAQMSAHYLLWQDLMGDSIEDTEPRKPEGDKHDPAR